MSSWDDSSFSALSVGIFSLDASPFVTGKYPTSYILNCCEVSFDEVGNYVILKNKPISKEKRKEFIPIGISKLHMGVLPLVKK